MGERQTEEFKTSVKLSGGPVFDPQNSHLFFNFYIFSYDWFYKPTGVAYHPGREEFQQEQCMSIMVFTMILK